jgi:hypothetical protein
VNFFGVQAQYQIHIISEDSCYYIIINHNRHVTVDGVWIGLIGFIDHLCTPLRTISNYNIIADFHTTNHSTLRLLSQLCLVTASNNRYYSAVFSLDVSWKRILTMEILQLPWSRHYPLVNTPYLNSCRHLLSLPCSAQLRLTAHLELRNSTADSPPNYSL